MNRTASLAFLCAALGVNACVTHRPSYEAGSGATQGAPLAAAPAGESPKAAYSDSEGYASSAPQSADARGYAPAPPSAAAKAERGAMEPSRDERPGLGTSWGETRSSRVSSAPFERSDAESPFA